MLSEAEIDKRLPVWAALADLFLDTTLDDGDIRRIATILQTSSYDSACLELILRHEVLPAFAFNLLAAAGDWTGWSEDQVRAIVTNEMTRRSGIGQRIKNALLWRDIEQEWRRIAGVMSEG